MNSLLLRRLLAAGTLLIAAGMGAPAHATGSYSGLVVFGDSLSDNGNNFLVGLYDPAQVVTGNGYIPTNTYAPAGVYSNGPVWASYFASMLGVPLAPSFAGGTDFASGGATTGTPGAGAGGYPYSLLVQAGNYLGTTGGVASPTALYVVEGGGNNARDALAGGADPFATAAAYAADVGTIVDELQAAGAQHILVWNTPNVGLAPAVEALGAPVSAYATFLSQTMNAALAARLAGEGVSMFDFFAFNTAHVVDPAAYGFVNASDACGAVPGADCSRYLYWDGIHPTTAGHLALAEAVAAVVPEPQTYLLFAIGLAAVIVHARRAMPRRAARST